MSLISSFRRLDKKFAWSFMGFLLAIIFGSLSVYTEFFRENNPAMIVEVLNKTNVLDVKEKVNELKIIYDDVDIKKLKQTLSVTTLRIKNNGRAPILKSFYDPKYPFIISLKEGKLLKVEQVNATNNYLLASAIPIITSEKSFHLPDIIIEDGESYTIKILSLHSSKSPLSYEVLGKIAGIKEIQLLEVDIDQKLSYSDRVLNGKPLVQLGRMLVYSLLFIGLIISLLGLLSLIYEITTKRKRKRIIEQFKVYNASTETSFQNLIFNNYIYHGLPVLVHAKEALADIEALKKDKKLIKKLGRKTEGYEYGDIYDYVPDSDAGQLLRAIKDDKKMKIETIESFIEKVIDFIIIKES